MWPEYPIKDGRGKSCWLHPRESGPEVDQEPGCVTTSPTRLGLSWCGASRTTWIAGNHEVFRNLLGLVSPPPSRGKAGMEMMMIILCGRSGVCLTLNVRVNYFTMCKWFCEQLCASLTSSVYLPPHHASLCAALLIKLCWAHLDLDAC